MTGDGEAVSRFEILPFGGGVDEALAVDEPLAVTVTCSPRHGIELTLDVATRLARHGHTAVVHLAARQVRSDKHLDELLGQVADAGINDVFLIGGDAAEVHGPYCSAHALLPTVHHHVSRPRAIGIGAYPEGHPLIDPLVLRRALFEKSEMADYIVTQLCFDPRVLMAWIAEMRNDGLTLPMYLGLPGAVDRRRLLEVSMRVGVGASVSFVRKQRGLRRLLGSPAHAADRLHGILAPKVGDSELGLAGLHWYTFNKLRATMALERQPRPGKDKRAVTTSD